ncbi:MAG TPA: hypothetical protein VKC15_11420, partial [Gemmatimonadales bacterium]|nr:hypothetical protein [Gemmatimonadales bacterium]
MRAYLKHPFWQAALLLVLAYIVIAFIIPVLPGSAVVPKSVVLQYMATVLVGILIWVSDEEERWTKFKEPLHDVLTQPRLKVVRTALLAAVTLIVGCFTYSQVRAGVAAPPNLRSIHPAPPSQITFRGKTINLVGLENPLRRPGGATWRRTSRSGGESTIKTACLATATISTARVTSPQGSIPCRPTSRTTARSPSSPRASSSGASPRAGRGCRARARRGI